MPRRPRLDYPGALHHVIAPGIERGKIFLSDRDRSELVERLARLVIETKAGLYAWSLMPNDAHALIWTPEIGLWRLVQRWLGPYVTVFNRVHRRAGHLFQNRFKNLLVEEEPYLLERIRGCPEFVREVLTKANAELVLVQPRNPPHREFPHVPTRRPAPLPPPARSGSASLAG